MGFILGMLVWLLPSLAWAGVTFDKVDDAGTTAGAASTMVTASAGTIVAWVRLVNSEPNSSGGACYGTSKERIVTDRDNYVGLGKQSSTTVCYSLYGVGDVGVEHTQAYSNGALTHLAMTWNGTTLLSYKDGVQVDSRSAPNVQDLSTVISVGGTTTYADTRLDGTIEEAALYDGVLAPDEIAALAGARTLNYGRTTPTARWDFRQCTGGASVDGVAMQDLSGNGRTLTMDNGANNTGLTCSAAVLRSRGN